jgi:RNA polymerase sigma-70 factor (ECF subfamily)
VEAWLRRRDDGAFDRLYDRHTPALYGLALRLTGGDESAAQDAVHDAWVRAVGRLGTFRWESRLGTWLGGFVVRCVREQQRRLAREEPLPDEGSTLRTGDVTTDERLRGVFDRVDLERALAGLPLGFRTVLVLHDVEGHTHDEIALVLEIAPGTSRSQLARARAALRRALTGARGA